MKTNLKNLVFNIIHRFNHELSDEQYNIISGTHIFNSLNPPEIKKILASARIKKYAAGCKIFRHGTKFKGIYIILHGTVNVTSYQLYNMSILKIVLNHINSGSLIGKNTHVAKMMKSTNTYLEAGTDVTLVHLDYNPKDVPIFSEKSIEGFHTIIEEMMQQIKHSEVVHFNEGDVIFNAGDVANTVYVVLIGKVKLLIPDQDKSSEILLNRGQMFGELGILRNSLRAGTAVAATNLKLLVIKAEDFKRFSQNNYNFKHMLTSLQYIYKIPIKDKVEFCISDNEISGRVLTSIYNLLDGRIIIASKLLNSSAFSMITMNIRGDIAYHFSRGNSHIQLEVLHRRIISIRANGVWEGVPKLCKKLLDQEELDDKSIKVFTLTGNV